MWANSTKMEISKWGNQSRMVTKPCMGAILTKILRAEKIAFWEGKLVMHGYKILHGGELN